MQTSREKWNVPSCCLESLTSLKKSPKSQKSAKVCKSLTSRKESSNVISKGLDVTKRSKCKVRVNFRNVRCSTLNRTAGSYVILFFFTSPAQSFSNAHVQCGCEMYTCSASATGPETKYRSIKDTSPRLCV